jgi:glycosyltransferase involved in cell wall biosynthesis
MVLDRIIKYQPPNLKEQLLLQLEEHTGVIRDKIPMLSVQELKAIHAKGFGIGAHAVTHPILSQCDSRIAYQEIAAAKETLENLLGASVDMFAYPNGIPQRDFGPEHVDMVKRAGYQFALTTHRGVAQVGTSSFQIPRFTPWGPGRGKMAVQLMRNLAEKPVLVKDAARGSKKALMIAFHFPPQAGSSGIQRTLNFVKYLPSHDIRTVVLTANQLAYENISNDLVEIIPAGTRVIRGFALDSARHLGVRGKYLDFSALPDRWATWCVSGIISGLVEIRRQKLDLLWSTYPIASAHLIGAALHRITRLPWVVDFRDPMLSVNHPTGKMRRRLWSSIEAYALNNAEACVFTSPRSCADYKRKYPLNAHKCVVIENGYDEEVFSSIVPRKDHVVGEQMIFLHSGIIYPDERNPGPLFRAIRELLEENQLPSGSIKIRFRAARHEVEVMSLVKRYELEGIVECLPPVAYAAAILEMLEADVLLVLQGRQFNSQVPAKIYEYLRTGRPLLALIDREGDTRRAVEQYDGVAIADIESTSEIKKKIFDLYQGWSQQRLRFFQSNIEKVRANSRASQSRELALVLHNVMDRKLKAISSLQESQE